MFVDFIKYLIIMLIVILSCPWKQVKEKRFVFLQEEKGDEKKIKKRKLIDFFHRQYC